MEIRSDNFYIDQVLSGDVKVYANLVNKHKDMAFTIAYKIVGIREDAEEIAQDAFVKAFQSLRSFKRESRFSTWLFRIVYNTAISKTRKKKIKTLELDYKTIGDYPDSQMEDDLYRLDEQEQKIIINEVLSTLDAEDHTLITLFYFKEQTVEELSRIVGISVSNVKVKLHRIRKKLKMEIQRILEKQVKDVLL